jgi:hypothetical protein
VVAWKAPDELTLPPPPPATVTRVPDTVKAPLPLPWQFVLVPLNVEVPSNPPAPSPPLRRDEPRGCSGAGLLRREDGAGSAERSERESDSDFSSLPIAPPALPDCAKAKGYAECETEKEAEDQRAEGVGHEQSIQHESYQRPDRRPRRLQ